MTPQPTPSRPRRAAFLVAPHTGGIYTVFANLRLALEPLGIALEWVGDSQDPEKLRADSAFANEMSHGILIDARGKSLARICGETVAAVRHGSFDLVFVNVLTGAAQMSVPAYLAPEVGRVMLVHNITPGTYAAARAVQPYVHATVGVSPRIREDLVRRFGFPADRTFCAPNAIDLSPFNLPRTSPASPLNLLSVGRVVDPDKGVFWLPQILERLGDLPVHLTVAGDGGDLAELKRRSQHLGSKISFLGRVNPQDIPALFARHDVFLMPSRFEGLPCTLIEAMAAGCVPVASQISGVTDFVVEENQNGLLFPIGNVAAAATAIRKLAGDRELCRSMSAAAPKNVRDRFSIDAFTRYYLPVLQSLDGGGAVPKTLSDPTYEPLSIGGAWRRFIPLPVKNFLRNRLMR